MDDGGLNQKFILEKSIKIQVVKLLGKTGIVKFGTPACSPPMPVFIICTKEVNLQMSTASGSVLLSDADPICCIDI